MSCKPMGRPLESIPHGRQMPGSPAKFTEIVYISLKYIFSGSLKDFPISGAVVGLAGPRMQSYFSNALSKACFISAFTFSAFT